MDTYPHISPTLELRLIKKENKKKNDVSSNLLILLCAGAGPGAGPEAGQGRAQGRVCECPSLHPSLWTRTDSLCFSLTVSLPKHWVCKTMTVKQPLRSHVFFYVRMLAESVWAAIIIHLTINDYTLFLQISFGPACNARQGNCQVLFGRGLIIIPPRHHSNPFEQSLEKHQQKTFFC